MPLSLYIDDGYTRSKRLDAAPGLHPDVTVSYRPALAKVRTELGYAAQGGADKVFEFESRLIERQRVTLDGEAVTAERAAKLVPSVRDKVLQLVLGYAGSDEEAGDVKNSPGG